MGTAWIKAERLNALHVGMAIATLIDTEFPADHMVRGVLTCVEHNEYNTTLKVDGEPFLVDGDTPVRLLDDDEYGSDEDVEDAPTPAGPLSEELGGAR